MIDLYSGTPGSGKSLDVANLIYHRLKFGHKVIANFDIDRKVVSKKHPEKLDFIFIENAKLNPFDLIEISRQHFGHRKIVEDDILLVMDECQLLFNAREWSKKGRDEWLSFFTQHRKYGFHVILIAQFDKMIDKQIRSLIEYEYVHRKVSNFGWKGVLLSLFMGGHTFVAVKVWYPLQEKVGHEFFHAKKKLFGMYNTYMMFEKPVLPKADEKENPPVVAQATKEPVRTTGGLTF